MEEQKTKNTKVIDLRVIAKNIRDNRRLFYKVLSIVFVLSCIYIFSFPRYYSTGIKLAPEVESSGTAGALGSLASSFGLDLSELQTTDAITPLLYPDLMDDNGFVSKIMQIKVKSQDGEINTNYHDYLKFHQKKVWWIYPIAWLKSLLPKEENAKGGKKAGYDPYDLPKKENDLMTIARSNISIAIDKKSGVISIDAQAQDPLICRTLADSVKEILQVYITDYRTNKARIDYEYYKKLTADAKREYEKIRQQYASVSDASTHISLRSVELKIEDMENDMQLKLNAYTTMNAQLQAAKAKVQEKTPAFTMIKGASVPVKPAGPKRMIFVAAMMLLATFITMVWSCRKYLLEFL